jgi:hypothetical protein
MVRRRSLRIMWNNFVIRHVTMIARGQPISNARAMAKCDATLIYLKSIFDEAIEQEFLVKDPTRTLKVPKNLRPKDKTDFDLGTVASGTGRGVTAGSHLADAGHDRRAPPQRTLCFSLEVLR